MNEKRFIIAICGDGKLGIRDLTTSNEYTSERQVADYMNRITDENEDLKKQREELFIRERDTKNKLRKLRKENYNLVKLINDLGSEEMDRQMEEILND